MNKITLDQESFKALAADRRVQILKLLHEQPHTQTELSNELKIKPASINEHLKALQNAQLIYQKDEGRKWKYYLLTEKGKCVLEPERKTIWITLTILVFSFLGTMLSFLKGTFNQATQISEKMAVSATTQMTPAAFESAPLMEESMMQAAYQVKSSPLIPPQPEPNYLLWIFVVITIITLVALTFSLMRKYFKPKTNLQIFS